MHGLEFKLSKSGQNFYFSVKNEFQIFIVKEFIFKRKHKTSFFFHLFIKFEKFKRNKKKILFLINVASFEAFYI